MRFVIRSEKTRWRWIALLCSSRSATIVTTRHSRYPSNNSQKKIYNLLDKKSTKNVKTDKFVSQDKNNNLQVTIKGSSKTDTRKVLKTGHKKNKKLSVSFSNRKPIEPLYEDSNLSRVIDYYNEHLRWQNPIKTPKFSSDIIASHKRASCSKTEYKKNYNLFHDGIHPNIILSKLWMHRILKLASELQDK